MPKPFGNSTSWQEIRGLEFTIHHCYPCREDERFFLLFRRE